MFSPTHVLYWYTGTCVLLLLVHLAQGWHGRSTSIEPTCGRARKCWKDEDCQKNFHCVKTGTQDNSQGICDAGKKSCREETKSGVANIYPLDDSTPLQVYCDQITDGGGWTVFQRRQDGSVDFFRDWASYQNGFGNLLGEFWLGLDALHTLTSRQSYELRVDLMKWDGTTGYATYSNFSISNSSDNYRLNYDSFTGGNAGDSLSRQRGRQFSTKDRDHDTIGQNCAQLYHGAWWYKDCHDSNLNAEYKNNSSAPDEDGLNWASFAGYYYSMKFTEMKLRPT